MFYPLLHTFVPPPPWQCCRPDQRLKPTNSFLHAEERYPFIPTSPSPSSRCDVDFIVARRNRFIQKFARTPSAMTLFYSPLFSGPDGFATVNEQMYYPPYTADAVLLFASLPTSFFSLFLSLNALSMYIVYLVFTSISYSA